PMSERFKTPFAIVNLLLAMFVVGCTHAVQVRQAALQAPASSQRIPLAEADRSRFEKIFDQVGCPSCEELKTFTSDYLRFVREKGCDPRECKSASPTKAKMSGKVVAVDLKRNIVILKPESGGAEEAFNIVQSGDMRTTFSGGPTQLKDLKKGTHATIEYKSVISFDSSGRPQGQTRAIPLPGGGYVMQAKGTSYAEKVTVQPEQQVEGNFVALPDGIRCILRGMSFNMVSGQALNGTADGVTCSKAGNGKDIPLASTRITAGQLPTTDFGNLKIAIDDFTRPVADIKIDRTKLGAFSEFMQR
ncbi:MAG: hypothetical protein ACHQ4J_05830, partial [Candidatus Binatia bacterium]